MGLSAAQNESLGGNVQRSKIQGQMCKTPKAQGLCEIFNMISLCWNKKANKQNILDKREKDYAFKMVINTVQQHK